MCRVEWSPVLELYELTAEVQDENGHTLMKGLSVKVVFNALHMFCTGVDARLQRA